MGLTQREKILRHLRDYGTLTRVEALVEYGIANPTARIADLRKEGYPVLTTTAYGKNRYGEPTHWAVYSLEGDTYGGIKQ